MSMKRGIPSSGTKNTNLIILGTAAVVALATLVMLWCVVFGFLGKSAYESGDYEKSANLLTKDFLFSGERRQSALRKAGRMAYAQERYEDAAEYYEKMGDEGHALWVEARCALAAQEILNGNDNEGLLMLEKLGQEPENETTVNEARLKLARQLIRLDMPRFEMAESQLTAITDQNLTGLQEFRDELYYQWGMDLLEEGRYSVAGEKMAQCRQNSDAKLLVDVVSCLESGNYYGAAQLMCEKNEAEQYHDFRIVWSDMLENYLELDPPSGLEDTLHAEAATLLLDQQMNPWSYPETDEDRKEWISNREQARYTTGNLEDMGPAYSAIGKLPGDGDLEVTSPEDIYAACGTDPKGKILILRQQRDYDTDSNSYAISLDLMRYLPADRFPAALSEVEYVILVSYSYNANGTYTLITKALRESGQVILYKLPEKWSQYSSGTKYGASAPNTFYYYGDPPTYMSGGCPELGSFIYTAYTKAVQK